ncbi:MAG: NAD+ synthase [Proteobacteria bacterium]|nr:NAD+ synthase [Pseudomonadota bacterium]
MRIALAQFDFPVGAVDANARRIAELIARARDEQRADVVLFPELAISGYPPEDLVLRPDFLAACEAALARVAAAVHGIVAVVGHPHAVGAVAFNAASVLRDGRIETTYRKRELPNYAVFDERRYFAAGDEACTFALDGVTVGVVICEDLWFAEPLAATLAAGAQLVLVPNASPFEHGKAALRDGLLAQRVAESQRAGQGVAIAYLNAVGGQDSLVFDGASCLADGDGRVHPAAMAFEDRLLVTDFNAATRRFERVHWPIETDESHASLACRAIVRGTADYVRKNGFSQVVLGLSGGVDSALVLAIAADALGADNVLAVRLPSRYTSDLSNDLAAEQCAALGVRIETLPIEAPFEGFLRTLAPVFAGLPSDVTEENLQSRCRGALLMALANKSGRMLLTTGNKSEYAVGYATIYGDMCGGYAPIKDLYKTEVYALCEWRNEQGMGTGGWGIKSQSGASAGTIPHSPFPIPAAGWVIPQAVIDRAPSAELRDNQTDQDSLPPYAVLDAILLRVVEQEQSRAEIVAAGFAASTVDTVLRLLRISEWKRQQAAPGPKVSRKAFGRERRYPITCGRW